MTPKEILTAARDLIAEEDRWTQGTSARDSEGNEVLFDNPKATCWCALAAISKASDDETSEESDQATTLLRKVTLQRTGLYVSQFNDAYPHKVVIQAFNEAIESAP